MGKSNQNSFIHPSVHRVDDNTLSIDNPFDIPATLYARHDVMIEPQGIDQALDVLHVQRTVDTIQRHDDAFFGDASPALKKLVLTPDFHPGSGIPVGTVAATQGFVLPQAVGNDICCGMRVLVVKNLSRQELADNQDELMNRLRAIFFEGKRDIAMSPFQREAMLQEGLVGLLNSADLQRTTWHGYHLKQQERDLLYTHQSGCMKSLKTFAFEDFIAASGEQGRDSQIGSVGGGNHFVEIQELTAIEDNACAHQWGLSTGDFTIMAHSGSVGLGRRVGQFFMDKVRQIYPSGLAHPENNFYPLPTQGKHQELFERYIDAMNNAANFAFANRLFLGLMVVRALEDVLHKQLDVRLLYDAPHNLIWHDQVEFDGNTSSCFVHRKGACPAYGPSLQHDDPFAYTGPPVIVPGSMGDFSYLLAGRGNHNALCSACHGAGRKLSRGQARRGSERGLDQRLRIVTPLDLDGQMLREHQEIRRRLMERIYEESPHAYKDVTPVVNTIEGADIAGKVACLKPWLTIKSA